MSNDVLEWSEFLTKYHGLNDYFQEKIVSGQVHMRKPDKEIFLYTLKALGCHPADCIFADNSVQNLLAARELGKHIMLFNRDGELYDGKVVNCLRELGDWLYCV